MCFLSGSLEDPLAMKLFLVVRCRLDLVGGLSIREAGLCEVVDVSPEEIGADQMDLVLIGNSQETLVHSRAPLDGIDNLVRQAVLAHNLCRPGVPDHQVVVFITGGEEQAIWADRNRSHSARVEREFNRNLDGEGFQVVWRGEFGDKFAGISHIDLLSEQSWAQVEVQAALEVLADQFLIQGNPAQSLNFLGHVVELTIFRVFLLPLLFLLLIEEVLLCWVVRLTVQRKRSLWGGDCLGHAARFPGHDGVVFPDVPCFLSLFLFLFLLDSLLFHSLQPAFPEGLDIL